MHCLARLPDSATLKAAAAARPARLAAIRLPLFLFILTEELTRSFLPLHIRELAIAASRAGETTLIGMPISVYMLCFAVATGCRWAGRPVRCPRVFGLGGSLGCNRGSSGQR